MRSPLRSERSDAAGSRVSRALPIAWAAGCFALWALHAWRYAFLCDDAFISFRYARNFAEGAGLVAGPGGERVEGYSNFLWVMLLAAGAALGIAPDRAANPLSLACSALLLWRVLRYARAALPAGVPLAWCAFPVAALAANRSFAVWSTSGLETRCFEWLVVSGVLAALREIECARRGRAAPATSSWWLAGAALARPDGLLVAGSVLAARAFFEIRSGLFAGRAALRAAATVALPVAAHLAFRWFYYGDVVPNTYHAKVGGLTWWSSGSRYFASFAIEYALPLWLPLLALGAFERIRAGRGELVWLCAAVVAPHALYIAAIGGDHFEYRPLDLYLPFGALLAFHGACALRATWRERGAALALACGSLIAVSNWLPELSHRDYPHGYRTGFPGEFPRDDYRAELVDTRAHPVLAGAPVLSSWIAALNAQVAETSRHYVGIRHEEHAAFRTSVEREAEWLNEAIASGSLPADAELAIDSVGVIPYRTRLRAFDRLGLTERRDTRASEPAARRSMAHERPASLAERARRNLDVDAADAVFPILPLGHPRLLFFAHRARALREPYVVARLPGDRLLVVLALSGIDALRARLPWLAFDDASALVEAMAIGGECGPRVPRSEQLGSPYDLVYVEQSKALFDAGLVREAAQHNRCALFQRPANPAARLRAQHYGW
jgi:hypothetical protein